MELLLAILITFPAGLSAAPAKPIVVFKKRPVQNGRGVSYHQGFSAPDFIDKKIC